MKFAPLSLVAASGLVLALAGCGHLEHAREGDPNRVVTGTVNVRMDLMPPADAKLTVRLVAPANVTAAPAQAAPDLVIGERGSRAQPEQIVAEQDIPVPTSMPAPFRLEFRASDAELRHGLNIEARLSWGGRMRFRTFESQVVTLETVARPQTVWIEAVR
ncbi:YbaY family lipoprotein [Opitutus sp. ER46]|uniref:YbaY family lipoprotein n=1 Tax=Opitutus sp. ER46 TaxID=2161864 RepID=UPI000D30384D|nr:YbaY family lipoprotein [Opitutus sp. ER46]PTX95474.1 hypothetical protein DB354_08590 [Opitutus sp. ER46]